jgi:hypothetical protein
MFGFFEKNRKPRTVLDAFIKVMYGDNLTPKQADLEEATRLAHEELLMRVLTNEDVAAVASSLSSGPIPYTTHDLAVSVALNLLMKPELVPRLRVAQLTARHVVFGWLQEEKVNPLLVKSFENTLYRLYKPTSGEERDISADDMAARMREEDRLSNAPPPCGSSILYRQVREDTYGEFIFNSVDIENALTRRLSEHPNLLKNDEGAILKWLRGRDDSISTPTSVPEGWSRFQFIADDVLRNGYGDIRCVICNKRIHKCDVVLKDDHGLPGWNFNRLLCPNNHQLLVVRMRHILMRMDNTVD